MREKLIEILETVAYPEVLCDGEVLVSTARVADHLLANGVTIPVRCKDCKYWERLTDGNLCGGCNGHRNGLKEEYTTEDDFCSYGERKDNEC